LILSREFFFFSTFFLTHSMTQKFRKKIYTHEIFSSNKLEILGFQIIHFFGKIFVSGICSVFFFLNLFVLFFF
jgi:hypothetical protein